MPWFTTVTAYPPDGTGAGVDMTCLCDTVTVNHGRDDSGSQPEASSLGIDFTVTPQDPLPALVEIGALLVVEQDTGTTTSERFRGRITDLALGWDEAGADTPDSGVGQLVAVGLLADLGRRIVGDTPWPQELDGARVARVMTAAGMPLDPVLSDPGTVQILPRDVDSQPALGVAQGVAQSGSGVVWQTRASEVRYADAMHRKGAQVALTLDACDLLVTPTWRRTLEGLVNSVSIGYGVAAEGGQEPRYVASNPTSEARFGHYGYDVTTELAATDDAQALGQMLLVRNSSPVWVMATLPVDTGGLDPARYDALLGLDMHSLLVLTGLPAIGGAPTNASLWVEGWKETFTWQAHEIDLVVSGYCRTAPAPRWNDVDPGWLWGGQALTEQRRNQVVNPSFETGDKNGWSVSTATWEIDGTTAAVGTKSLKATRTTGNINFFNFPTAYPCAPGEVWTFSLWYKTTSAAAALAIIHFRNSTGGIITQPTFPLPATNVWTRCSGTFTAPAGTVDCRFNPVYAANGIAGDMHWFDGLTAERAPGPVGPYFDGDTPDTTALDYAWSGARGLSASVQSAITPIGNGLPSTLTWDGITCLGPPVDFGRWDDVTPSLRWDLVPPTTTWNNFGG